MKSEATLLRVTADGFEAGTDKTEATTAFASLFKIPEQKAGCYLAGDIAIQSGLTTQQAEQYRDELAAIGVVVRIEADAANDDSDTTTNQASPTSTPVEGTAVVGPAPAAAGFDDSVACPKCNTVQPKCDQCSNCGIYLAKLTASEADDEDNDEEQSNNKLRSRTKLVRQSKDSSHTGKYVVVLLLVIATSLFMYKNQLLSFGVDKDLSYSKSANYQNKVEQLIQISGTEDAIARVIAEFNQALMSSYPDAALKRGVSRESINYVGNIAVPALITAGNATTEVGNWLQSSQSEAQISRLVKFYDNPLMEKANLTISRADDSPSLRQSFLLGLESSPLPAGRRAVIIDLANAGNMVEQRLDLTLLQLKTINAVVGASLEAPASDEALLKTARENRALINDRLSMERAIRQEVLANLAWIFRDYNDAEIQILADHLDDSGYADFQKQVLRGLRNHFSNSANLIERANQNRILAK